MRTSIGDIVKVYQGLHDNELFVVCGYSFCPKQEEYIYVKSSSGRIYKVQERFVKRVGREEDYAKFGSKI